MKAISEPITLKEYISTYIPKSRISTEEGWDLWQRFGSKINIEQPSFKNLDRWEITSQGWVGFISFSENLAFYLEPKVPLKNLFGMWEYAYKLKIFENNSDLYNSETLQQFYEQLANVLAKRTLDRSRKGFYRTYISRTDDLSFLRGKLELRKMLNKPWETRPRCNFQENTADVEENQILAWTLYAILRSGFCTERVLPMIRNAYRNIGNITTLQPFFAKDCSNRIYNRLNQDYHPLHALSRFFLDNTGPSYQVGEHTMLPFLVNMAVLFELFVAEWLKINLPDCYKLVAQEKIEIGESGELMLKIDLVISDSVSGEALYVIDTKYKKPESPSNDDIAQVNLYAGIKDCPEGILLYPGKIKNPLDITIKGIRIRSAVFSLENDLEKAGQDFLLDILPPNQLL